MFEFLKRKYRESKILGDNKVTESEILVAVNKGWITQEQMNEILTT
jgi:hypothetical protein